MPNTKRAARLRRKKHIRRRVHGTSLRPRMSVFRSLNHIYVQVIDDEAHKTLVQVSTMEKVRRDSFNGLSKVEQAKRVGKVAAELCEQKGITQVVFDRGGYRYHGRVEAIAAAARDAGLTL